MTPIDTASLGLMHMSAGRWSDKWGIVEFLIASEACNWRNVEWARR